MTATTTPDGYTLSSLGELMNNNKKFRSFKSKENICKKEVGPLHGFSY